MNFSKITHPFTSKNVNQSQNTRKNNCFYSEKVKEFVIFIQSTTASPISGKSKSYPSKKISRVIRKSQENLLIFSRFTYNKTKEVKLLENLVLKRKKQLETREVVERGVKDADLCR